MQEMDKPENLDRLARLGATVAEKQVKAAHFPAAFYQGSRQGDDLCGNTYYASSDACESADSEASEKTDDHDCSTWGHASLPKRKRTANAR